MMSYIPERPLEPPEPTPDFICDECENWFYGDEPVYISDGKYLCEECFREQITALPTDELAEMAGAQIITAQEVRNAD